MATNTKSYLQIARESKNKSREAMVVEMETGTDVSTLFRYEQEPSKTPADIFNIMVDKLDDEYLAYLYLRDNPVACRFIPGGVQRLTKLQAVVKLKHALKAFYDDTDCMEIIAVDDVITEDEQDKWNRCKRHFEPVLVAWHELECADGAEFTKE